MEYYYVVLYFVFTSFYKKSQETTTRTRTRTTTTFKLIERDARVEKAHAVQRRGKKQAEKGRCLIMAC